MEEYQMRMLIEARDLANKLNLLNRFMHQDVFLNLDREEKDLMYEQSRAMSMYLQILGKRLEKSGVAFTHNKEE